MKEKAAVDVTCGDYNRWKAVKQNLQGKIIIQTISHQIVVDGKEVVGTVNNYFQSSFYMRQISIIWHTIHAMQSGYNCHIFLLQNLLQARPFSMHAEGTYKYYTYILLTFMVKVKQILWWLAKISASKRENQIRFQMRWAAPNSRNENKES